MGEDRTDQPGPTNQRVTVPEAAELLDITAEAVRMRIKRGTLRSERQGGRVFVMLGQSQPTDRPDEPTTLISEMRSRIQFLEDELQRKDAILLNMTEAMKALSPPTQEAPSEAREPPQTVEEVPERATPQQAEAESQEGVERPQQRSGWLAPVDKLPWWHYVVGIIAVFLAAFFPPAANLIADYTIPTLALYVILLGAAWAVTGAFGFWVGFRQRIRRFWPQIISIGAVVGAVAGLGVIAYLVGVRGLRVDLIGNQVTILGLVVLYALPAWLLFVSASLLGNTWQRRRIGRISGTTPASPVSRTRQGAGQQPRKDLTPAQQAMLGWGGTIISALITLVGTIIAVRSGP